MAASPYFVNSEKRNVSAKQMPKLSHELDSVRAYQWEVLFYGVPVNAPAGTDPKPLTLACKSVSPIGWDIEKIETNRVNDKFFYPGKATPTEVTMVFDNLFRTKTGTHLFNWLKTVYNPETGEMVIGLNDTGQGTFKIIVDVLELNNQGQPFTHTRLYGFWPRAWTESERNYATNDFHTIEITGVYDLAIKFANANT